MGSKARAPEIIIRNGKPAAVILDIDDYREMLERLEDRQDLKILRSMRERPLRFKKLEDFLSERRHRGSQGPFNAPFDPT